MIPISIKNLEKSYDPVHAVRGVSFDVQPGEIFGLIGPDGAGKTTILRILVSLLQADKGSVLFQGRAVKDDPKFVRTNIGYMPQRFSLYRDLTVEENLRFFGDLFRVPSKVQKRQMAQLYDFSRLGAFKDRRAEALSGGMKQKLALSCMLMHEPSVIVLDEPTFGVDPVSRSEFWGILKKLAEQGTSILVTTAYMDEAQLCDRVALIFDGEILALDRPQELLNLFEEPLYLIETEQAHHVYEQLRISEICGQCTLFGNGVHITDFNRAGRERLEKEIQDMGIKYSSFRAIQPELEDLFLRLIRGKESEKLSDTTENKS